MNNAHLKLNSMSEFTALWNSGERFRKFAEQVYRYLERMKPGTVLALERYSGEQLEWIIKTACVFILEGDNYLEYEFNEDYTAVVHRYVPGRKEMDFKQVQTSRIRRTGAGIKYEKRDQIRMCRSLFSYGNKGAARLPSPYPTSISYKILVTL